MCLVVNKWKAVKAWIGACIIIMVVRAADECGKQNRVLSFFVKYTIPIFVMHTLFAAALRALLLKTEINNAVPHVIGGLAISFASTIIAAEIMKKQKFLSSFFIRKSSSRCENRM